MKLYCVRHGESTSNVLRLCNADPAVPVHLTRQGVRQARLARQRLTGLPVEAVYASELPRAIETARVINRNFGVTLQVDARLNDRRTGFEGRPVDDYLAAAAADPLGFDPPDGETRAALKARVAEFLDMLRGRPHTAALVVTHHEVLQIINGLLLGIDDLGMWRTWIDNGQILTYDL